MPRCRRFAIQWQIFILLSSLLCFVVQSASIPQDSAVITPPNLIEHSSLPRLEDCANWSGFSSGDATEEALHTRMCNRSVTLISSPPAPETPPKDDVESVKAIEEAVLEVLPTAQQNFALTRDGAKVLAYNPGAKKVGAILDDDTDTFMRNECRDDKWVVLELSQVAKISRIEIIQHELYSSRIKEFEIRGRQSHPRTDNVETSKGLNSTAWKLLGKFTAQKAKGTQQFNVERPLWAHYLLIRFLTHYGSEPVCALNALAVYGKSAAEELEDQLGEGELALEIESEEDRMGSTDAAVLENSLSISGDKDGLGGGGAGGGFDGGINVSEDKLAASPTALPNGDSNGDGNNNKSSLEAEESNEDPQQHQKLKTEDAATAKDGEEKEEKKGSAANKPSSELNQQKDLKASATENPTGVENRKTDAASQNDVLNSKISGQLSPDSLSDTIETVGNAHGNSASSTTPAGTAVLPPNGGPATEPAAVNTTTTATATGTNIASATPPPLSSPDAPNTVSTTTGAHSTPSTTLPNQATTNGGAANGLSLPFDVFEPLPVPKMKTGAGVYEVLVQEIRVTKAQQRVTSKALEALQRNLTAATIALSRMKTEYELSDIDLGKKVDSMISQKLTRYEVDMLELRNALKRAAKREHAALSLLAMLGGALVLSVQSNGREMKNSWRKVKIAVVILALANGAVGVALHWQSAGYFNILIKDRINSSILNSIGGSDYFLNSPLAAAGGAGAAAGAPSQGGAPSASASSLS